jgi:DDE family transposase
LIYETHRPIRDDLHIATIGINSGTLRVPVAAEAGARRVPGAVRLRRSANTVCYWGKRIYKRRKETVERSFADAKQLHGHRYARFRGLVAVACQCLLAATAQNIKKIALALAPKPMWA